MVGRVRERHLLLQLLNAAVAGAGGVVLIGGEPGIGKTTLVDELRSAALANDFRVLVGHCYDLTMTPPYGPWRDVFTKASGLDVAELAPALATVEMDEVAPSSAALFEQMRALVVTLSADQPVAIVLEDLHWSDPASLDLLRFLAREVAGKPVLIAVTYRDTELTRHHPLFSYLPLLVREASAQRIDLRRLSPGEVQELVAARYELSADAEARLVSHLQAQADGNPLFAGELLRTLEEDEFLTQTAEGWELRALDQVPVPALVVQVIEGRLARLGEDDRRLLQIAAVIGHVVPVDLWRDLADVDEEYLLALIEQCIVAHLLTLHEDDTCVRFVHSLVRQAVYGGILPARRRGWHRQVAEHLLGQRSRDPDIIARHFQQAGDERAAGWLIQAGERAQRAYAMQTAADRFDEALRLLDADGTRALERGWLIYRIGRLLRYADVERGIAYLERAGDVADAVGDRVLAAYSLADRGGLRCMAQQIGPGLPEMESGVAALDAVSQTQPERMGDPVAAWVADSLPVEAGQRSDAAAGSLPAGVVTRRGTLILWLAWAGRYADALAIGEPFVALTESILSVRDGYADAVHGLGMAYAATGRLDRAREAFDRARDAYRSINHHVMVGVTTTDEWLDITFPYRADRVEERRGMLAEASRIWRQTSESALNVDWPRLRTLMSDVLDGAWQEAREAAFATRNQHNVATFRLVGPALGRLAREQGDPQLAWKIVREHLPEGPVTEPGSSLFLGSLELQRLAVDLALDAGNLAMAREWLSAHDRWIDWSGDVRWHADRQLRWARYHHAAGDATEAVRCANQGLEQASEPRQPLTLLAVHRFLGQLATEAGDVAFAEQSLRMALDLADACAVPFERALTLLAQAELRQVTGAFDEARSLLEEVRSICVPLGATPTLARVDALEAVLDGATASTHHPAGLTAREVEVLRLVAQGLTDSEVAERLFVARRTVNTHLTSIYTKLNVSSRAAATRFAVENGLA